MQTDKGHLRFLGWGLNGDNPVVNVSWFDAARYANWLSKHFKLDTVYIFEGDDLKQINYAAKGYRLPTEVEWEYAAKGGPANERFKYAGSNDLDSVGWYNENSGSGRTQPVAGKKANSLGLYDLSGNVWELCNDWYEERYPATFPANYHGPDTGEGRVMRGGCWFHQADLCWTAYRFDNSPTWRDYIIGFRLVIQL